MRFVEEASERITEYGTKSHQISIFVKLNFILWAVRHTIKSFQSIVKFRSNNKFTAAVKLSTVAVGGGLITTSDRYFPVFTNIPFIPMFIAPRTSSVGSCKDNAKHRFYHSLNIFTYIAKHNTFLW